MTFASVLGATGISSYVYKIPTSLSSLKVGIHSVYELERITDSPIQSGMGGIIIKAPNEYYIVADTQGTGGIYGKVPGADWIKIA